VTHGWRSRDDADQVDMSAATPGPVTKVRGDVFIRVLHTKDDRPVGSQLEHEGRVYRIVWWPQRIRQIEVLPGGELVVTLTHGRSLLLDPAYDALETVHA
jgi:hypothetical protein